MSCGLDHNGSEFDRLLLDQIADRRSILVLGAICAAGGTLRFNEVRRRIDGIAQKTLTQALRRLERNGMLERRLNRHRAAWRRIYGDPARPIAR